MGEQLAELERPKAEARKAEGQSKGGKTAGRGRKKLGGNLPPSNSDKTRDRVAAAVGMSGKTYEKAKKVVEQAPDLVAEMDRHVIANFGYIHYL